ncbi:MAG: DEAD/DEAH box helicase [Betaproteobacteria bacterium]|nr:MAG: DEAD/DEAH box helicase [Betaproteobacteria bacterium]
MSFSSLGLSPALLRALKSKGYSVPTPVQSAAIPAGIAGRDVLGSAQTGSGKTIAFALPILQRFDGSPATQPRLIKALVLVPTRELAAQVGESFRELASHLPHPPHLASAVKVTVVFGGVSINPQMLGLRGGTDIVVATPGRLLDLIDHNAIKLNNVQTVVLDEADRLLDLGFSEELGRIFSLLPKQRQHLFFSATFPPAVERLANALLHDPVRVAVETTPDSAPDIAQRAILVDAPKRTQLLRHLIDTNAWQRVLVFVATKHAAEIVAEKLRKARINAEPFHGELSQGKRTQVLADFKASRLRVVVATDVASRGIDIAELPVVVNFDLPRSADDYTHRIGRTARAGESGIAVSFVSAATEPHFFLIRKRQGLAIELEHISGFEAMELPSTAPRGDGGIKGARPNKKDKLRAALINASKP